MELSSFSENIVTETIERNGDSVELQINIDVLVPGYFEVLEERLEPLNKRLDGLRTKLDALQKDQKKKSRKNSEAKPPSLLSIEKEMAEIQREAYAERLTCPVTLPDGSFTQLLKGWTVTVNGDPIPPSKENLMKLPPKTVSELWERCIARTETVKKTEGLETVATSETTRDGSPALRVVGQNT